MPADFWLFRFDFALRASDFLMRVASALRAPALVACTDVLRSSSNPSLSAIFFATFKFFKSESLRIASAKTPCGKRFYAILHRVFETHSEASDRHARSSFWRRASLLWRVVCPTSWRWLDRASVCKLTIGETGIYYRGGRSAILSRPTAECSDF